MPDNDQRNAEPQSRSEHARVFISYGRKDAADFAHDLATWLRQQGYEPWLDVDNGIAIGDPFDVRIELGISSSELLIAVLSPWSLRPEGFCRNELLFAQAKGVPIIPVRVADITPPIQIMSLNYLDVCDDPQRVFDLLPPVLAQVMQSRSMPCREWPGGGPGRPWWADSRHLSFREELARHGGSFIGRDWLFRQLREWTVAPASRFLLLTADAGVGKSAIAAQMTARLNVRGVHFCSRSQAESCRFRSWLGDLIQQLASQFPCYARLVTPLGPPDWEESPDSLFRTLVVQPLNDCRGELDVTEPWVFVVDALDESLAEAGSGLTDLLADSAERLPDWLRIIATSRPDRSLMARFELDNVSRHHLDADCEPNREDVATYIKERLERLPATSVSMGAAATAEHLATLADGNFLFAKMTLDALADPDEDSRLRLEGLGSLPRKLGGLYNAMFRRRFSDLDRYTSQIAPLLDCLVAARDPLPEALLVAASGLDRRAAQQGLRQLSQFLSTDGSSLRLFHQSVADWLVDDRASGDFAALRTSGHQRLAEAGWQEFSAGVAGMSPYMILHLALHLAQAGRPADLAAVLGCSDWAAAKLAASDPFAVGADYGLIDQASPLRVLQDVLRLAAFTLARHPEQFAAQVIGRLGDRDEPELAGFLQALRHPTRPGWSLLPRNASLRHPGAGTVYAWRAEDFPPACHLAFNHDASVLACVTATTTVYRRVDTGTTIPGGALDEDWREIESPTYRTSVAAVAPTSLPNDLNDWSFRQQWERRTPPGQNSARVVVDWVRENIGSRQNSGDRFQDLVAQEVFLNEGDAWVRVMGASLSAPVTAVAVSSGGDFLALSSTEGELAVWAVSRPSAGGEGAAWREVGKPLFLARQEGGLIRAMALSPAGNRLATLKSGGMVTIWATTGAIETTSHLGACSPATLIVNPSGTRAYVLDADQGQSVWDTRTGERLVSVPRDLSMGRLTALRITPDHRFTLSVVLLHDMYDGFNVRIIDIEAGRETMNHETSGPKRDDAPTLPRECWSVGGRLYARPGLHGGCVDLATGSCPDWEAVADATAVQVDWGDMTTTPDLWCCRLEAGWTLGLNLPWLATPLTFSPDDEIEQMVMSADGSCVAVGCRSGALHFLEPTYHLAPDEASRRQVQAALGSPQTRVRCLAARALASAADACAAALLQQAARKDPEPLVRHAAMQALVGGEAATAIPTLRAGLADDAPLVRAVAVEALATVGDVAGLVQALALAESSDRLQAAEALGRLESPEAAASLEPLVQDADSAVALAARTSLVRRGGSRAVALLEHLNTDRPWAVAELVKLASPAAVEALVRLLERGCDDAAAGLKTLGWQPPRPDLKARFFVALGQWDEVVALGAAAVPALVEKLQCCASDWQARGPTGALMRIGDTSAVPQLLPLLTTPGRKGAGEIAETVALLGGPEVEETLLAAHAAITESARHSLLPALAATGASEAVAVVITALREGGPRASLAARAAALCPNRDMVVPALLEAASAGLPDAIDTLAALKEKRAIPVLLQMLESGPAKARVAAASAVAKIVGDEALPALTAALKAELARDADERDCDIVSAIAAALVSLQTPQVVPHLAEVVRRGTGTGYGKPSRVAADGLLGLMEPAELIPLLARSLRRTTRCYGGSEVDTDLLNVIPKALDALQPGTTITDAEEAAEGLVQALPDAWRHLQPKIADMLGRIGEPAISAIEVRWVRANWQEKVQLVRALAAIRSPRCLPLLKAALADDYAHIRLEAAAGLCKLGTSEALAVLRAGVDCTGTGAAGSPAPDGPPIGCPPNRLGDGETGPSSDLSGFWLRSTAYSLGGYSGVCKKCGAHDSDPGRPPPRCPSCGWAGG